MAKAQTPGPDAIDLARLLDRAEPDDGTMGVAQLGLCGPDWGVWATRELGFPRWRC